MREIEILGLRKTFLNLSIIFHTQKEPVLAVLASSSRHWSPSHMAGPGDPVSFSMLGPSALPPGSIVCYSRVFMWEPKETLRGHF